MADADAKRALILRWRVEQETGRAWRVEELEDTLTDVKYWLHDGLVMHRLVSDPRQMLRKIEDVLG